MAQSRSNQLDTDPNRAKLKSGKTLTQKWGFTESLQETAERAGKPRKLAGKPELVEFVEIHRIFRQVHPVEANRALDAVKRRIRGSRRTHDGTIAVVDCRRREA